MVKGSMAKGSIAGICQLGFTSDATGQDPESSQTDAEMCHNDLAF